jgi:hypothetical protein
MDIVPPPPCRLRKGQAVRKEESSIINDKKKTIHGLTKLLTMPETLRHTIVDIASYVSQLNALPISYG